MTRAYIQSPRGLRRNVDAARAAESALERRQLVYYRAVTECEDRRPEVYKSPKAWGLAYVRRAHG